MHRLITYLTVQLLFVVSWSQEEKHYNFIHYPPESGIISNQINTATQDEQGYIWLAGTHGLQRFDGVRFKTFRHEEKNPNSIPSNPVWQVLIDKKKNLWLLLADGRVGIFDTRNFTFREAATNFKKPVSPNTSKKRLISDEEGNVFYIISGSEVITYNAQKNSFSYEHNFFKQQAGWNITDFIQQPDTKKYWIAIENSGIAIFNKATGALSYNGHNTEKEPAIAQFANNISYHCFFFDAQKRLWSVTKEGRDRIQCYSLLIEEFFIRDLSLEGQVSSYFDIKAFMQQRDGSIWINGMLLMARFREAENRFEIVHNGYVNERSIAYEMVHCLYEDKENNIWVCTDNNGIYRFNPSKEFFTNINHTNPNTGKRGDGQVLSFIRTKWNTVLVSTWNDGVYEYNDNLETIPLSIKGLNKNNRPYIWSMTASQDSNIMWFGAEPGLYAVNQTSRTAKYYNPPVLENSIVRQVAEDKSGALWLGTQSKGVFTATINKRDHSIEKIAAVESIPAAQVNKITIDTRGMVWVGTPENGLYVLGTGTGKLLMHFSDTETVTYKIPERGISSVLQYNDSIMLISTATRLVKYNMQTKTLKVIGGPNYISGFITAIEKDKQGYLWLTSTSGLYQIDIAKEIFILYDRGDGLDNEHFVQSASYTMPDGRILFGATHNFVSFLPKVIKSEHYSSTVRLTDIKLKNEALNTDSILSLKKMRLRYDDNPLVIEFSPFLYSSISILKYKMEGLDKDWNVANRSNQAVYNYLPPGEYSFMIQPSDDMGNELPGVVMLMISVNSPVWKTWWFYSLVVLFAGVILYWLDRERMSRKEAMQKMRTDIADDLHEDVNTALNNINILSEMARLKADTEPKKSKEFIEQINTKSHNMILAMDDMLWSINPGNDSMERTISRLKEVIESLKSRYNVEIDLLVDDKVKALQLNMKQRKEVFWFFKGGITNVVRTGGSDCFIHISYDKQNLIYTLEVDNTNLNAQQFSNLRQREELRDKLTASNATLDFKELKSKTILVLTIPLHR